MTTSAAEPEVTKIAAEIREIFARELGIPVDWVEEASNIREVPGMESLRLLRAVTRVEKRFGIELADEAVFAIDSVTQLATLVAARLETPA